MILLQIVTVSPGTQFVKNDESQSRTSESQLKKAWAFMQPDSWSEDRLQNSVLQY